MEVTFCSRQDSNEPIAAIFAHGATAVLSWHVYKFVAISQPVVALLHFHRIWITMEMRSWSGSLFWLHITDGEICTQWCIWLLMCFSLLFVFFRHGGIKNMILYWFQKQTILLVWDRIFCKKTPVVVRPLHYGVLTLNDFRIIGPFWR